MIALFLLPYNLIAGTASGQVRYENKTYTASGFTGSTEFLVVRQAQVEVVDTTNTVLGSGVTDNSGNYSISVPNQGVKNVFLRVYARNTSSPFNVTVKNSTSENQIYTAVSGTVSADTDSSFTLSTDINITSGVAPVFNIFDCAVWAFQYFSDQYTKAGLALPSVAALTVYWKTGSTGTFFDPASNSIFLLGFTSDPDEYDDDIILHEVGHYMAVNYSKDDSPGGQHSITDKLDARLAWSEGWAHYFSCVVRKFAGSVLYPSPQAIVDNTASGAGFFEIETPSLSNLTTMATNEVACTAVLWDIVDATNESFDTLTADGINMLETKVWRSFLGLTGFAAITLEDMTKSLYSIVSSSEYQAITGTAALDGIYKGRSIRYYLDTLETNDSVATATNTTLPFNGVQITHHTSPPNSATLDRDFFKVNAAIAGVLKVETKNLGDGIDTNIRVFQSDGFTLVKENDDVSAGNKTSLVQTTVQIGTYYVLCERSTKSSNVVDFGYYDISISVVENLPPDIASVTADKTSGQVPFTVQFSIQASDFDGNIATYQWDVDGDSVYEFTSLDGGNFVYTYALAGTYNATVKVTDNKGESTLGTVQIVASGQAASIQLSQNKVGGTAPVTVSFTVTPNSITPVLYLWDFDADKRIDLVSETGSASFTYNEPKSYVAKIYVRDVQDKIYSISSDSIVVSDSGSPVITSFTATPSSGTVPLNVSLSVSFSGPASSISKCEFDIQGDGIFDAVVTNITASPVQINLSLKSIGTFNAVANLTNTSNISSRAQAQVKGTFTGTIGFINEPEPTVTVAGSAVTITAIVLPTGVSKKVQFQYKPDSSAGPWIDIGSSVTSTRSTFKASWDTSALVDSSVIDLRALINDSISTGDDASTVQLNFVTPKIRESSGSFNKQKKVSVFKNEILLSPEVELYTFYDSISASNEATLKLESFILSTSTPGSDLVRIGDFTSVTETSGVPSIQKPLTLRMYYKDDNEDGIVDGWNLSNSSLAIYYFDEVASLYKQFFPSIVNTSEKWVQIDIHKFGKYALVGKSLPAEVAQVSKDKSGGCFNSVSFSRLDYSVFVFFLLLIICRIVRGFSRPASGRV